MSAYYDLILEGKKEQAIQKKPLIEVSKKEKLIKTQGNITNIDKSDMKKLKQWLRHYRSEQKAILTLQSQGILSFTLPQQYLKYSKSYVAYSPSHFNNILPELQYFDLLIQDKDTPNIPVFKGLMSKSIIKFSGEFYANNTKEYTSAVFSWLELFLASKPQTIRVEFWMNYFNTAASLRFLEFFKMLENYQADSKAVIKVFWHWLDRDKESKEEGKYYEENTTLNLTTVKVSEEVWEASI